MSDKSKVDTNNATIDQTGVSVTLEQITRARQYVSTLPSRDVPKPKDRFDLFNKFRYLAISINVNKYNNYKQC